MVLENDDSENHLYLNVELKLRFFEVEVDFQEVKWVFPHKGIPTKLIFKIGYKIKVIIKIAFVWN